MRKTAIIVPCYNEGLRLNAAEFLASVSDNGNLYYIFVNDGSTDNTHRKLDVLCRSKREQLRLVNLDKNYGKAEAVRQGVLKAMEADFSNIGYWDADLSAPLYLINRFCEIIEATDKLIVIGSRVRLLGREIKRRAVRHYLGRIFATFAGLVLGLPVYDTQCGAKLFKNSDELKRIFDSPFTVKWTFDVEILARYINNERSRGGIPLEEVAVEYPLEEWRDVPGSKIKWRDFAVAAIELFKIFLFLHAPKLKAYVTSGRK